MKMKVKIYKLLELGLQLDQLCNSDHGMPFFLHSSLSDSTIENPSLVATLKVGNLTRSNVCDGGRIIACVYL